MTVDVEFGSKAIADRFREDHPEHVSDRDDRRLKTVRFEDDAPAWLIERAESEALAGAGGRSSTGMVELTESERQTLERTRRGFNWQEHGFEAMRVKAALQAEGATEWTDFYETGEGVDGALSNLEASKERSAQTGASIGVGGGTRDVDPEQPERMRAVANAPAQQCDHAEDVCRRGDPEACEFLGEACGFSENEIDRIMGIETDEPADIEEMDGPFTGPQLGALRRSWGGYYGALRDLEDALDDVQEAEQHATDAIEAVNAIRRDAGQDPIEPERLNEIREMDMADVCERGAVDQLDLTPTVDESQQGVDVGGS